MKDDSCLFFFSQIPELGSIKEKIFEGTTSSATCPLKLAEMTLPGIRQCRTVNLSGKGPLLIKTLCSYFCGWSGWILLGGRMLSYAKAHKENDKSDGNNREMYQIEAD